MWKLIKNIANIIGLMLFVVLSVALQFLLPVIAIAAGIWLALKIMS